jgi:DNA-binding SARP family transcriptional activator
VPYLLELPIGAGLSVALSAPSTETAERETLCLLGGPYVLRGGRRYSVPEGSKRLLAFVALHGGRVDRRHAAGTLWPCGTDERAAGNLRSALWRLKGEGIEVLEADKFVLSLREGAETDVHAVCDWASRVVEGQATPADLRILSWDPEAAEILPGWYEDWVICERERIRQRLLHGLEAVSRALAAIGRTADAVEAAMNAVRCEPLRESAQQTLIEAHLAERNYGEALRAFDAYERLLLQELGIGPTAGLVALVRRGVSVTTA